MFHVACFMNKPTLVILPGWGGSSDTWKDFIALAMRDFRVECINLPCFGNEPCPSVVWGVEEYANFVISKFRHFDISKCVLLGHSFGGQVAAYVAAKHPEYISHLVLVGAAAIRPWRPIRRLFLYGIAKMGKFIFRLPIIEKGSTWGKEMLYKAVGSRDYNETAGIKREIFKKITREDLKHLLPVIAVPTLVVWGTKDRYVPLRYGKRIARLIPRAELQIIRGGGHGLHLTHRNELVEMLRVFAS